MPQTRHEAQQCTFLAGECWHRPCRMATLRAAGKARVADRLTRNAEARDWAGNFGRLLYDPHDHGRDATRRALMARMLRLMRRGAVGYAAACVAGAWTGATLPRAQAA